MTPLPADTLRGLPGPLPAGEHALWQGSPRWTALAVHALHVRLIGFYFVGLAVWQAVEAGRAGAPGGAVLGTVASTLAMGAFVLALAAAYAWAAARSTTYTITTRRVVLTFGIALPVTLSLPFKSIGTASLKLRADGTGDIPLGLAEKRRMSALVLWPHLRPWRLGRLQPMLRAVPEAARVAEVLSAALVEAQAERVVRVPQAHTASTQEPAAAPAEVPSPAGLRPAAA